MYSYIPFEVYQHHKLHNALEHSRMYMDIDVDFYAGARRQYVYIDIYYGNMLTHMKVYLNREVSAKT